jgi:tRNA-dihydrouridine synthase B
VPTDARLTDPWRLGPLEVPNRVLLAPLAGIGNWFVRLQAKRFGAGMAVSEMVSSYAIHYRNEKTCTEMLRIDPRERQPGPNVPGGPVSIQLFGEDPDIMRSAAASVAATGADAIDINMGCPVPKVAKTGAGAALLADPDRAVAIARATVEGANSGDGVRPMGVGEMGGGPIGVGGIGVGGIPITVKLRSGLHPGDESGFALAHRLVEEAGVAAIAFHPRSAAVHHKGRPDYELAARLVESLPAPVILTGGMDDADSVREAFAATGATAVMLARGALGNPWLFEQLLDDPAHPSRPGPSGEEVLAELRWTIDCAVEHLGEPRATRYLRKFYPWYLGRLGLAAGETRHLQESLQSAPTLERVQSVLEVDVGELALAL